MFAYRLQDAEVATEGPFRGGTEGTTLPMGQTDIRCSMPENLVTYTFPFSEGHAPEGRGRPQDTTHVLCILSFEYTRTCVRNT